jgi:hypothetical protein
MPLRPSVIPAMPGMPVPDTWQPNPKRAAAAKSASADSSTGTGNKHPFLVILTKQQAMDIYSMRSPTTTRDPKLQVRVSRTGFLLIERIFGDWKLDHCPSPPSCSTNHTTLNFASFPCDSGPVLALRAKVTISHSLFWGFRTWHQAVAGKSSMVAEMYGVSPKTIRDIWNRKTWAQVG